MGLATTVVITVNRGTGPVYTIEVIVKVCISNRKKVEVLVSTDDDVEAKIVVRVSVLVVV